MVSVSIEFGILKKGVQMVHAKESKGTPGPWARYSTCHLVGTQKMLVKRVKYSPVTTADLFPAITLV